MDLSTQYLWITKWKKRVTLQWRRLRRLIREKTEQSKQVSQEWDKRKLYTFPCWYRIQQESSLLRPSCQRCRWQWWRSVVSDSLWPPRPIACQAPLSIGFPRQEYWSGLPSPPPGDLLTQELNPHLLHWQEGSLSLSHLGSPVSYTYTCIHSFLGSLTYSYRSCLYSKRKAAFP